MFIVLSFYPFDDFIRKSIIRKTEENQLVDYICTLVKLIF